MCGFVGVLSRNPKNISNNIINLMTNTLSHRGPNDLGIWQSIENGIGLGHRRLSVLDLTSTGRQPMKSPSGRYIIAFNGEIYNHLELRKKLNSMNENLNICWKGTSDTETILACFEKWGIKKTIQSCIGMFAFAVWDSKDKCILLARDRMGEKPIYYSFGRTGNEHVFMFASELKALKAHPAFSHDICPDIMSLYFRYNYVPAPYSIYKKTYKLKPGCILKVKSGSINPIIERYWSLPDIANKSKVKNDKKSSIELVNNLDELLRSSVKRQLISDVSIGAFLSGGIDSSSIVAIMQNLSSRPVKTFSIGFNESNFNEAHYAKEVADHIGTDHCELYVSAKDAMEVIPDLPNIYDEPFSDSSQIPTYLVSKLAKEKVTVALSGDGGDELFGGYNRYTFSKKFWGGISKIPFPIRNLISNTVTSFSPEIIESLYSLFSKLPLIQGNIPNFGDKVYKSASVLRSKNFDDLYINLISHWNQPSSLIKNTSNNPLNILSSNFHGENIERIMILDALTYLPDDILVKTDRAAMANSLETRVPFLDHNIVEFAFNLPLELKIRKGQGKWILRQVLYNYLPKEMVERPKMGFGIPIGNWLKGPLKQWAQDMLNEETLNKQGFFHTHEIQKKWDEHISGRRNWQYHLWDLLMFQSWLEKEKSN